MVFQNCENQKLDYSLDKLLIGRWTEIEPILGRTELDILNNNQIEVITTSNQAELSYTYILSNDSIELSSNEADVSGVIKTYFRYDSVNNYLYVGDFLSNDNNNTILTFGKVK